MLDTLRRIVLEVSATQDLEHALSIVVTRIKQSVTADVCSVYLADPVAREWVLSASDGLNPASIGKVKMPMGEGLISLVCEREEPLNLDDAPSHPRYRFVAETNEEYYHAFLGVPIIHHRQVLGVLVIRQQQKRLFDENEVSFLITLAAQLAGAIAHAQASGKVLDVSGHDSVHGRAFDGLPGAPGVSVGQAHIAYPGADLDVVPDRTIVDIEAEVAVFLAALDKARSEIKNLAKQIGPSLATEDRALFDAYLMMLNSDSLIGKTIERIRAGSWASGALRETIKEHARIFDDMDDAYMRERASDVRDLGRRILVGLQSGERNDPPYPERTILVGEEITATMLAEVPMERLAGVISVRGSSSSHVAILARSLGVPAILGATDLPVTRIDKCQLVVDGYRGRVYVSPSKAVLAEYERLEREEAALAAGLEGLKDLPAQTLDGISMPVYANTGLISDITPALNSGAEGIGLHRTEFPFMVRDSFPGEDEQRRIYRTVLEAFAPRHVTLRTLDIGGDKSLSYFPIREENPFLGWRGIRVTLDHPEIFLVQLRAMLRASIGLDNLQILLPMVSSISELDAALRLIERAYQELRVEGDDKLVRPKIGMMIEVPSTVYQMPMLSKRVDFFSVGTNDLTQYLLAVDRNNPQVARLYDSLHPAVLQAIIQATEGAHQHHKPISVCGEMAGDPASAILLLAIGVDSLSMSVASLAKVKWVIRSFKRSHARTILKEVLLLEDSQAVRAYLDDVLEQAGLGNLVRAGK